MLNMFTTPPRKAGGVLLPSNRKASTANELLALFGAQETPSSVTKSRSQTPSTTPASSSVTDLERPGDYLADLASPFPTLSPYTRELSPFSTCVPFDQHDVLYSREEQRAPGIFVPTASHSYGVDDEQQQSETALQMELEQSDPLRNNSIFPDYSSEEPFSYSGIVRAIPQDDRLFHSLRSTPKLSDQPKPNNGELEREDSGVALPLDLALGIPHGLVGSRASIILDCIDPALIVESFGAKSNQQHTSNLIRLSSPLSEDEPPINMNPKNDVIKATTPRPAPNRRNNMRKTPHTNKSKPGATPKRAKTRASSRSRRLFVPAQRHGVRKPGASKPKPAVSNHTSSHRVVGTNARKTNDPVIKLFDPIDP